VSSTLDPRIGTELAGYRIEALLGRGGMSVVYRAEDLALERKVALKVLAPELAENERFRERFLRESRVAASIDHSNIIPIYEARETDGLLYIAMRYVEGTDLGSLLEREGPLEPDRALSILGQVASALDTAHFARGLVHRDVKPGNILIAPEPGADPPEHAYLCDFGLSKHAADEGSMTEGGELLGTLDYVAPEQIETEPVDGRTDVYSLGCVLYECLTGDVPYRKDSKMALLWAHLQGAPPSASEHNPELPAELDAVIARALAKSPDDRYPTCRELIAAARAELRSDSDERPAPGIRRAGPALTRRTWLLAALLALLVAAAAAVPAILLSRGDDGAPGRQAETPAAVSPVAAAGAGQSSSSAAAAVGAGSLIRIDPKTNQVVATIPVGRSPRHVTFGQGAVWIANHDDGTVSKVDPQTNAVAETVGAGGAPEGIVAGGEGAAVWVAKGEDGVAAIREFTGNAPGEQPRQTAFALPLSTEAAGALDEYLDVALGEGSLWAVNYAGGTVLRIDPESGEVMATIEVPGKPFTVAVGEGSVWVGDHADGNVLRVNPATNRITQTIDLGGDGRGPFGHLEVAVGEGSVWVTSPGSDDVWRIDPKTGDVVAALHVDEPHPEDAPPYYPGIADIAVGRGAVWVAFGSGTVSRLDPKTGEVVSSIEVGGRPFALAVSEDGVWVTRDAPAQSEPADAGQEAYSAVFRIDPGTNEVVAKIDVGDVAPWSLEPVASADGAVWVSTSENGNGTLTRIDPETNAITETVSVPGWPGGGLAVGDDPGTLWVADGDRSLLEVRLEASYGSNRFVSPLSVGSSSYPLVGLLAVAVGENSLWAVNNAEGTVSRVDPSTGDVLATMRVGDPSGPGATSPASISFGDGSVWVGSFGGGKVWRIDPATDTVVATIALGPGSTDVAAGGEGVWAVVFGERTRVAEIDPATNRVATWIDLGEDAASGEWPVGAVVVTAGAVWVTDPRTGTVVRIDPETGEIVATIELAELIEAEGIFQTFGLAVDDSGVWVAVRKE